jgi:hypothetical protein
LAKRDKRNTKDDVLTERQKIVVECIKMRLSDRHSLEYLAHHGYEVSLPTLTRDKRKVESKKMDRLFQVARIEFEEHHLDRIDNTEIALKLMWGNYHAETNPFRRVLILEKIVAIQPYLSSFYEVTKHILENSPRAKMQLEALENLRLESKLIGDQAKNMIKESSDAIDKLITNKDNGLQHQHEQSEQKDNNLSDAGERTGDVGKTTIEGEGLSEGEEVYRRQKDRAVF